MNDRTASQILTADHSASVAEQANEHGSLPFPVTLVTSMNEYGKYQPHEEVGLPPIMSGMRYDALREDIKRNGIRDPICVDDKNVVWEGRTRLKIAKELDIPVPVRRIDAADGLRYALSGLVGRKMTIPEQASFVWWVSTAGLKLLQVPDSVREAGDSSDDPDKRSSKKRNLVSLWVKHYAGWSYSVSPKTIAKFLKLAVVTSEMAEMPPELFNKLCGAKTITSALNMLKPPTEKKAPALILQQKLKVIEKQLLNMPKSAADAEIKKIQAMLNDLSGKRIKAAEEKKTQAKAGATKTTAKKVAA